MPKQMPKRIPDDLRTLSKAAFPILYVAVLIIGMVCVYASQNGQLQSTKQQLTTAQATAQNQTENQSNEAHTIDISKYQAVFLSSGQVYFGKMTLVDQHYLKLTNIYYLQTGSQNLQPGSQALQQTTSTSMSAGVSAASNTSVSLVKLGCELHKPYDTMTINRDRVDFWENLQDQGQVVRAIQAFDKTNPSGQSCTAA
jgi:hypothetical protein